MLALDSDNDGLEDGDEASHGCDPDNWDSDGDGMPDGWEVLNGLIPYIANGDTDKDMDTITNFEEYSYAIPGTWNVTIDGIWWNGTNPSDSDSDDDGLPDGFEINGGIDPRDNGTIDSDNGPNGDPDRDALNNSMEYAYHINPRNWDYDGDGMPDGWEVSLGMIPYIADGGNDNDMDTISNVEEYRYAIPGTWNVSLDGVWWNGTDPSDWDSDNDGMQDGFEINGGIDPRDNGTIDFNNGPNGDPDNDAATNYNEYTRGLDPQNWDCDYDAMPDGWEIFNSLFPSIVDGNSDRDMDQLTNYEEYSYAIPVGWNVTADGIWWKGTDPNGPDTDHDSLTDGWEVTYSLDPRDDGEFMWQWNSTQDDFVRISTAGNVMNGGNGDPDNDDANNSQEYSNGCSPRNWDSDTDEMPDGWEIFYGLSAYLIDSGEDPDWDGLLNLVEYNHAKTASWDESANGVWWNGTNPKNSDTDNDTLPDGWEIAYELDPTDNGTLESDSGPSGDPDSDGLSNEDEYRYGGYPTDADTDKDGIPDGWEAENSLELTVNADGSYDPDSDGLTNLQEYQRGTDPHNDDTDGDGLLDGNDPDPLTPASVVTDDDLDGDGVSNDDDAFPYDPDESVDSDNDGVGDNADAFPNDAAETVDTDGDGSGNNADTDDDNDTFLDEWEVFMGTDPTDSSDAPLDTDGDGIPDGDIATSQGWMDTDDDNDNVPDSDDLAPLDGNITEDTIHPIANAGSDKEIVAGAPVTFDGSASTDNLGIANYTWTFNYNGTLTTLYGVSPTFTFWTPGDYTVTLTVTDVADNEDADNMTVTVDSLGNAKTPGFGFQLIVLAGLIGILICRKRSNKRQS